MGQASIQRPTATGLVPDGNGGDPTSCRSPLLVDGAGIPLEAATSSSPPRAIATTAVASSTTWAATATPGLALPTQPLHATRTTSTSTAPRCTQRTTTTGQTGSPCALSKHRQEETSSGGLLADLFEAYYCARRNKRNTASQVRFERALADNMMGLYNDIVERRYKVGRSMCFIVNNPVKREVFAAAFRDRVVHHLLYNYLSPVFERRFIYDSYSCREGKGTLFGIERLEHHIRSCSNNYTVPCHVLKLDIEGYFMSIDRQKLYDILAPQVTRAEGFDSGLVLYLLGLVVFNDPTKGCYIKGARSDWDGLPPSKSLFHTRPGCGLPIGNLTSQLFSNVYLDVFDQFMKRELGCRHYGRYVDDFYVVGNDREWLASLIPRIREFLKDELHLRLHPKKVTLQPCERGVSFLGAYIRPHARYVSERTLKKVRQRVPEVLSTERNPYVAASVVNSYSGYLWRFGHRVAPVRRDAENAPTVGDLRRAGLKVLEGGNSGLLNLFSETPSAVSTALAKLCPSSPVSPSRKPARPRKPAKKSVQKSVQLSLDFCWD